jgi:hypothetical protein
MNFGPLEFAAHLRRKDLKTAEPATVRAARAAAPALRPIESRLTIVSASSELVPVSYDSRPRDASEESDFGRD